MNRQRNVSGHRIAHDLGQALAQRLVTGCIRDLQSMQTICCRAMTREGEYWDCKSEGERESYPVLQEDVVVYIRDEILGRANDWNNERIRRFLARRYEVN